MKRQLTLALILCVSCYVAACGGETADTPPPPPAPIPDTSTSNDAATATDDADAGAEEDDAGDATTSGDTGEEDGDAGEDEDGQIDPDSATEDAVEEVIEEPECVTDEDCIGVSPADPVPCTGQLGPSIVNFEELCVDGFCEVNAEFQECCAESSDCTGAFEGLTCHTGTCNSDNWCVYTPDPNCCTADEDCAALADGCCQTAQCVNDSCQVETLTNCCEASADCDDGVDITVDTCVESCVDNGCENIATGCGDNILFLNKDFDDGTLQLLASEDTNTSDNVAIQTVKTEQVSPKYSVYFGDVECEGYYNGPMTDCVPNDPFASESTPVNMSLTTQQFILPAESGSYLGFWINMAAEPAVEADFGSGPILFPTDYFVVTLQSSAGTEVVWKSTDPKAFGKNNTSNGWTFQATNLSQWAGQAVSLTFTFVTDNSGNYNITVGGTPWHGVYLDEVYVTSTCDEALCSGDNGTCPNDGQGCTENTCTPFAFGGGGVCAYQTATPGQECTSCGVAADCGNDPCFDYECGEGTCSATVNPECCEPSSTFPYDTPPGTVAIEGFESGALSGWIVEDPLPDDNISWQLTQILTYEGDYSLYFGDPNTLTYLAQPANPAKATIWSPVFEIPDEPFQVAMASFWLWMSTEYDGAVEEPDADESFDRLSVWLKPAGLGDAVEMWASVTTVANSTGGKWLQIGVDLSGYEGQDMRLGFHFDSGDEDGKAVGNAYGGVRIDNLTVSAGCGAEPCMSFSDCADEDPCTSEYCDLGICAAPVDDPTCCFMDEDCADDNECTLESCVDNTCEIDYDTSSPTKLNCCPANGSPWLNAFEATFEDGADGFTTIDETAPVVWSLVDGMGADDSAGCYNFADPSSGTYSNPEGGASFGALVSPVVSVPPMTKGNPYAEFDLMMETEWDVNDPDTFFPEFNVDELVVKVAVDGDIAGATPWWTSEYLKNTTAGEWHTTRVDLDAYRGMDIQLVFEFTTSDEFANSYAGPYVDNISFTTTCISVNAIQCINGADCSPQDECKDPMCSDDFKCLQVPKSTPECCEPYLDPEASESFDDEPEGWTSIPCNATGGNDDEASVWQVTHEDNAAGISAKDGAHLLYFGNGTDYGGAADLASCDSITSAPIALTPGVPWSLSFWVWMDIEKSQDCLGGGPNFSDNFIISIQDTETGDLTPLWLKLDAQCNQYDKWVNQQLNLDAWAGKTIKFHFSFESFDSISNSGKGIGIDKIELTQGCPDI